MRDLLQQVRCLLQQVCCVESYCWTQLIDEDDGAWILAGSFAFSLLFFLRFSFSFLRAIIISIQKKDTRRTPVFGRIKLVA
jgi:hypothetical protein